MENLKVKWHKHSQTDVGEVIGNHMKQPPAKKDRLSGGT